MVQREQETPPRCDHGYEGDVVRAWSPARVYDEPGGYAEAPWYYEFGEHREMRGMRLPATAVATFEKDGGPAEYFRGRVTALTLGGRRLDLLRE